MPRPRAICGDEQFEHPARAGAGIEHVGERGLAEKANDRLLDILLRHMERTDALPLRGIGLEIGRGDLGARRANGRKPARIVGEQRRVCIIGNG